MRLGLFSTLVLTSKSLKINITRKLLQFTGLDHNSLAWEDRVFENFIT